MKTKTKSQIIKLCHILILWLIFVESFTLENVRCEFRVRISCASERKIQNDVISYLKLLEGVSFPLMAMFELLAVISFFLMLCARAMWRPRGLYYSV